MAYEYMLDALDQTKIYLAANLEAALAAIETARSLASSSIARWTGIDTSINLTDQYPYIELLPDVTNAEYGSDENPYSEEHWNYNNISILITSAGYDQGALQTELLYYAEAVERVIKGSFTFGGLFNRVRLLTTSYALLIEAQEDKLIKQTIEQSVEVRAFSS
tara:strand:- start:2895 stop:3383 length:489 start_codon:yes stop_codon:yes gene_type:complete